LISTCEFYFKIMLKIQYLVFRVKYHLYASLKETSTPFAVEVCYYNSKHKSDWTEHCGIHPRKRLEEGREAASQGAQRRLAQCFLCFHNENLQEKILSGTGNFFGCG
ncbi:Uncharacterized protein FKW44_009408, partial [Caligus rogercresseyi]